MVAGSSSFDPSLSLLFCIRVIAAHDYQIPWKSYWGLLRVCLLAKLLTMASTSPRRSPQITTNKETFNQDSREVKTTETSPGLSDNLNMERSTSPNTVSNIMHSPKT